MQRQGVPVDAAADIEVVVRAALEAPHRYVCCYFYNSC